jgi:hypothetical protein
LHVWQQTLQAGPNAGLGLVVVRSQQEKLFGVKLGMENEHFLQLIVTLIIQISIFKSHKAHNNLYQKAPSI